jgi:hypothetical protein
MFLIRFHASWPPFYAGLKFRVMPPFFHRLTFTTPISRWTLFKVQGDKEVSVHLMITVQNSVYSNNPHTIDDLNMAITECIRNVGRAILNGLREHSLACRKCLETGGDTLNITCNFMYCNHQVHRNFLSPCIFTTQGTSVFDSTLGY